MQQEKPAQERRKYMRLEASVQVSCTIIGQPGTAEVFSKNISAGGLCIITERTLPSDTPLQLTIKIPDLKDPIIALGRIVWQKNVEGQSAKYDTGVEFTGISDFDRFNINRFVLERIETEK